MNMLQWFIEITRQLIENEVNTPTRDKLSEIFQLTQWDDDKLITIEEFNAFKERIITTVSIMNTLGEEVEDYVWARHYATLDELGALHLGFKEHYYDGSGGAEIRALVLEFEREVQFKLRGSNWRKIQFPEPLLSLKMLHRSMDIFFWWYDSARVAHSAKAVQAIGKSK